MGSYILNFTVYTMAMCGLICFALFAYKKFAAGSFGGKKSEFLGVEDSLSLAPRKMLYVVRAGNERFLIASDADKTNLISKLQGGKLQPEAPTEPANFETQMAQGCAVAQKVVSPSELQTKIIQRKQSENNSKIQNLQHGQKPLSTRQNREDFSHTNKEKTAFIGIDDLPQIKINSNKKNHSADVLKSMISRIKE